MRRHSCARLSLSRSELTARNSKIKKKNYEISTICTATSEKSKCPLPSPPLVPVPTYSFHLISVVRARLIFDSFPSLRCRRFKSGALSRHPPPGLLDGRLNFLALIEQFRIERPPQSISCHVSCVPLTGSWRPEAGGSCSDFVQIRYRRRREH